MLGMSLGMLVESSVAVLLAVTIGYCVVLNTRLKRLHADREALGKIVSDLVQATALANSAIRELKTAALEADTRLGERLEEAEKLETTLGQQLATGGQLIEKISRITAAARAHAREAAEDDAEEPAIRQPQRAVEPQGRLHSALQQLAMRPGIGGKAA